MTNEEDSKVYLSSDQQKRVANKKTRPRDFNRAADIVLKKWAQTQNAGDGREIRHDTGAQIDSGLGKAMKRAQRLKRVISSVEDGLDLGDDDYDYLQAVVSDMSQYNRMFLFAHYLKRPKYVATLFETVKRIPFEPETDYSTRVMAEYYKRVGLTEPTYHRYLREAKYEFLVRGGIQ